MGASVVAKADHGPAGDVGRSPALVVVTSNAIPAKLQLDYSTQQPERSAIV